MADGSTPDTTTLESGTGTLAKVRRSQRLIGNTRVLEATDTLIYLLVGASFLLAAILSLAFSLYNFGATLVSLFQSGLGSSVHTGEAANAIITFVSDLLLTLIILEVMGTIVHYLQTRATSLKPFLFIGIISATRGILAVGAQLTVTSAETTQPNEFRNAMIELGVNAGVIIALGVTLRLIGHYLEDTSSTEAQSDHPSAARE